METTDRRGIRVGWMVLLDGRTVCDGCAPDRPAVRRTVGVAGDDVAVVVRPVDAGEAVALEAVCVSCGRPLAVSG